MKFKTEKQLREEFETMVEGTMNKHLAEFIACGETIKKQQQETIAQMRKEGFYKLANETEQKMNAQHKAEQKMNAQHEARQKQIAEAKEEIFQQYFAQYNKYKEKIIAIQKLADEIIKKVAKETEKAIKRMKTLVP